MKARGPRRRSAKVSRARPSPSRQGRRRGAAAAAGSPPPPGPPPEQESPDQVKLSRDLEANRSRIGELLGHSDDLVRRDLRIGGPQGPQASLFYYQALADGLHLNQQVVQPLLVWARPGFYPGNLTLSADEISQQLLVADPIQVTGTLGGMFSELFSGNAALLVDGLDGAILVRAAGYRTRAITEPMNETGVRTSAEGFIEEVETNTSLIRRRLRSPHLVVRNLMLGDETRTRVRVLYDQRLAPPGMVEEVWRRLGQIRRDGVLQCATVEYLIADHPYALWPTIERTERPERVVDQLLQGRLGILVDNSPFCLLVPATASSYFWAPDDQAESFYFSSLMRLMRVLGLVIASFGTPVYVALVTFHPEMIPLPLMLSIAHTQEGVPFPLVLIAFTMEAVIEIVREAGIRLPRPVGSAVSIVGAIVVGQAAITAGFAPPGLVVVVAVAAIASFALPDYGAAVAYRLLRFPALLAAAMMGLYGVTAVALLALFDMTSIKSLGVPFLTLYTPGRVRQLLESVLVAPARLEDPVRRLSYRDRYRVGQVPRVRSRLPGLERANLRRPRR